MRAHTRFGLIAAASLALAGIAHAQPGLSTKPDYDLIYKAERIDENASLNLTAIYDKGVAALQAKDYAAAEAAFTDALRRKAEKADISFMLGLAQIGLEKWDEAKVSLEAAVAREPKRPEPKTRLGLTYVKLNNLDAAKQQRAALAALDADCVLVCKDAQWIAEGLRTLDQALAPGVRANVSAASLAAMAAPVDASKDFDPSKYSLVAFSNTEDLYDLLTREGRCPEKTTAAPRQPCALILYRPTDGSTGALSSNFKPVFKIVNRKTIWAIHDKKLQKVKIEDLYYDNVDVIGGKQTAYISVALVGNAENTANCMAAKPCLSSLVSQDMFNMYTNMPDSVVEVVWGSGMKDVGTIRVR